MAAAFVGWVALEFGEWAIGEMIVSSATESSLVASTAYEAVGFAGELSGEAGFMGTEAVQSGRAAFMAEGQTAAVQEGYTIEAFGDAYGAEYVPGTVERAAEARAVNFAQAGTVGRAASQAAFKTSIGHSVVVTGKGAVAKTRKLLRRDGHAVITRIEQNEDGERVVVQHKIVSDYGSVTTDHGPIPGTPGTSHRISKDNHFILRDKRTHQKRQSKSSKKKSKISSSKKKKPSTKKSKKSTCPATRKRSARKKSKKSSCHICDHH